MMKLHKRNVEDIMALSQLQEGMLFYYLMEPDSTLYHEQISINIKGNINFNVFKESWDFVIQQNEMLRASFRWDKLIKPIIIIMKERKAPIKFYNLEKYEEGRQVLDEIIKSDLTNQFDLEDIPFRIILCKITNSDYTMVISNHHMLWDGWSSALLLKEFQYAYLRYIKKQDVENFPKCRYKMFLKDILKRNKEAEKIFWKKYLNGFVPYKSNMEPLSENRKKVFDKFSKKVDDKLYCNLKAKAKSINVTIASFIYLSWGIVLKKHYNCKDIVFGVTVSTRNPEIENIDSLVGLLINTVPLRIRINDDDKISTLISSVTKMLRDIGEYNMTPLIEIKNYIGRKNENIFNSIVTIENYPIDKSVFKDNDYMSFKTFYTEESTNFDLTLTILLKPVMKIEVIYNNGLYANDEINYLMEYLLKALETSCSEEELMVYDIKLIDDKEKNKIISDFNDDLEFD